MEQPNLEQDTCVFVKVGKCEDLPKKYCINSCFGLAVVMIDGVPCMAVPVGQVITVPNLGKFFVYNESDLIIKGIQKFFPESESQKTHETSKPKRHRKRNASNMIDQPQQSEKIDKPQQSEKIDQLQSVPISSKKSFANVAAHIPNYPPTHEECDEFVPVLGTTKRGNKEKIKIEDCSDAGNRGLCMYDDRRKSGKSDLIPGGCINLLCRYKHTESRYVYGIRNGNDLIVCDASCAERECGLSANCPNICIRKHPGKKRVFENYFF